MLGYGHFRATERLSADFKISVFYSDADDCIGLFFGQNP